MLDLLRRLKERRAEKEADRKAIAAARHEQMRAGDDEPESLVETVENADQFTQQ